MADKSKKDCTDKGFMNGAFGTLYDFNGDGKTSTFEAVVAFSAFEEFCREVDTSDTTSEHHFFDLDDLDLNDHITDLDDLNIDGI